MRRAGICVAFLLLTAIAFAEDEVLGSDYRAMSAEQQNAVVTGLWYGITVWSYHLEYSAGTPVDAPGPANAENLWLVRCNKGKTANDMNDLYNQYLDSHEELWHFDIGTLFVLALQAHCNSGNS